MKYYLTIVKDDNICVVDSYGDYDDALAKMHRELGYRGEGRAETICSIINSEGSLLNLEHWKKQAQEAEVIE